MHYTLADLLLDISQNAAESGADLIEIELSEKTKTCSANPELRFMVRDNGKGMDSEELKMAEDPFFTDGVKHPHRKVGLGLPFMIQTAQQSGGGWDIKSQKMKGTEVCAWFDTKNVDTPPAGDIPGTFRTILMFPGPDEIIIRRKRSDGDSGLDYILRKTELSEALGGLDDSQSLLLLDQYLHSMEEEE